MALSPTIIQGRIEGIVIVWTPQMSNVSLMWSLLGVVILGVVSGCGNKAQPQPVSSLEGQTSPRPTAVRSSSIQPQPVSSVEEQFAQIVALGPGIYAIQNDTNGNVVSCIAVGQSKIIQHTPETLDIAVSASRQAAIWKAYAELSEWMKSEMSVSDEGDSKESSQKLISGIALLHINVDKGQATTTVAIGWRETPDNKQSPEQTVVRHERVSTTDAAKASERILERIWINDVLVIEEDFTTFRNGSTESGESKYRQWDSIGQPKVDIVMKVVDDGRTSQLKTNGAFWDGDGIRIAVDVKD